MRERVTDAVENARPYVERMQDDEFQHHVKNAYESARRIYDELIGPVGATGIAMRAARSKDIRDELRKAVEELRDATDVARGKKSHTGRNMTLLLAGITLGVLFNPMTGPDARRWVKDKVFGSDDSFEYSSMNQSSASSPTSSTTSTSGAGQA